MKFLNALARLVCGFVAPARASVQAPPIETPQPIPPAKPNPLLTIAPTELRQMPPLVSPPDAAAPLAHARSPRLGSSLKVVGVSFYQPALWKLHYKLGGASIEKSIAAGEEPDEYPDRSFTATLKPEPDNPVDVNSIVVLGPEGQILGHLSRDVAAQFQPRLLVLGQVTCLAELRGGGVLPMVGVVVHWSDARRQMMAIKIPGLPSPRKSRARVTKEHP